MNTKIEELTIKLNNVLDEIFKVTNALAINIDVAKFDVSFTGQNRKHVLVDKNNFENLTEGKITCIEKRDSLSYPFKQYILIDGVIFFCLHENDPYIVYVDDDYIDEVGVHA